MHKCIKCGTEFEGKYCPECGSKWSEEKTCPKCGTKLGGGVKYCIECGYAFVTPKVTGKEQSAFKRKLLDIWMWLKSHLKIVVPVTMLAIFAIVMLSLIPTFILASVNGTYYASSSDGTLHEDIYITLSTGKWKTSTGTAGEYKVNGKQITLIYHDKDAEAIFGKDSELAVQKTFGEVCNKVLNISGDGNSVAHYCQKSHKHKYSESIVQEATCTIEGVVEQSCLCGFQKELIIPAEHKYSKWITERKPTCTTTGFKKRTCSVCNYEAHSTLPMTGHNIINGVCTICKGGQLSYQLNEDKAGYAVTRMNQNFKHCESIEIPALYNELPLIGIGREAFFECDELTSIVIPDGVTYIGVYAFARCSGLRDIYFKGTENQWNDIQKGSNWDFGMPTYTVHCSDGDIVVKK